MLALDLAFERIDYLDARPLTPIGSAYRHELLAALQAAIAAQESGHNDADHESLTPVAWLRMLLKDAYRFTLDRRSCFLSSLSECRLALGRRIVFSRTARFARRIACQITRLLICGVFHTYIVLRVT